MTIIIIVLDLDVVPELPATALVTLVNEFTFLTDTILTTSLGQSINQSINRIESQSIN